MKEWYEQFLKSNKVCCRKYKNRLQVWNIKE